MDVPDTAPALKPHRSLEADWVLHITAQVGEPLPMGTTLEGETQVIPITGGTVEGPGIHGQIVPGGADWNTQVTGGLTRFHARYNLLIDDGTVITVINAGLTQSDLERSVIKTKTEFLVANDSPHAHLRVGIHVGTLDVAHISDQLVEIDVYRLR